MFIGETKQIVIMFHSTTNNNPGKSQSTLIVVGSVSLSQTAPSAVPQGHYWTLATTTGSTCMHQIIQPYTWPALVGLHVVFRQGTRSPVALADEHAGGHHPSYISTALSSDVHFQEYLYW